MYYVSVVHLHFPQLGSLAYSLTTFIRPLTQIQAPLLTLLPTPPRHRPHLLAFDSEDIHRSGF